MMVSMAARIAAVVVLTAMACLSSSTTASAKEHLNEIDRCWRKDPNWAKPDRRKALADCAVGFGAEALGGKAGKIYTVTSEKDDDPANPRQGTLRHAVTRSEPLWIVFARDMNIKLRMPLFVSSHKTIDGRGANVHIAHGPGIRLNSVSNVIIHGLSIHHCSPSSRGNVLMQMSESAKKASVLTVDTQDGDAISIVSSSHVWIDHNTLSQSYDGLVDVTLGSSHVTVSNNHFSHHDKVMLLGHSDDYSADKNMKVTVAFNHFGPGLAERMPRVRYGYAHVANNYYELWGIYAMGGSSHPTIRSEGNYFVAPNEDFKKQVTWREGCTAFNVHGGSSCSSTWLFKSVRDAFANGAIFSPSGKGMALPSYSPRQQFKVGRGSLAPLLTSSAGALSCVPSRPCLH